MTTQTKLFFVFPQPGSRAAYKVGSQDLWTGSIPKDQITDDPSAASLIVVLGGDGTFLHAIGEHHVYGAPFFGIHFGTVGFLMNRISCAQELLRALDHLETVQVSMMIASFVCKEPEAIISIPAFNDVYFNAPAGKVCRGWIQGDRYSRHEFQGDGLIVSSPQGSTAYNHSAGGPILELGNPIMAITTICAQGQPIRDVIENQSLTIGLENCAPVIAHADGKRVDNVRQIGIRPNFANVNIAFIGGSDFLSRRSMCKEAGDE